ncbi:MAG: threonine synthase, partial [Acidobacteria bacterium RBG_16_64_8]
EQSSSLSHLECTACKKTWSADVLRNLCPSCGKVLFARYSIDHLRETLTRERLIRRPASIWRYLELLPVYARSSIVSLGEGMTPLIPAATLRKHLGVASLLVKDEGQNPTGTFKARGISVAVSKAKELGAKALVMPSAGNAGAALAAYGSRAALPVNIVLPAETPDTIKIECGLFGARVHEVDGSIRDAGRFVAELRLGNGSWFDVSTLKEPYRLEGEKTMGFEIAEQLGWELPDVILYPTGGGTGLLGIWKAFEELEALGWIRGRKPRMVVVQADGCAPIVNAFRQNRRTAEPWAQPHTVAAGLLVPEPVGDYLILDVVRQSRGTCLAVSDRDIISAMHELSVTEGLMASPEGAATLAGLKRLIDEGQIQRTDRVLLLNTGSGLLYTELMRQAASVGRT